MRYAVIDTNVLVVADGGTDHADDRCRRTAAKALQRVEQEKSLVLDEGREILREYSRNVDPVREPGVGSLFFVWAVSSFKDHRLVSLASDPDLGYLVFPSDPRLEGFDRDDRKFVAATIASGKGETELVNAVDSDYTHHRTALEEAGVKVTELCPEVIRRDR